MPKILDLTGVRFGRLVAQSRRPVGYKSMWVCQCDCGNTTTVFIGNLRSGSITSCGCRRKEVLDKTTHGKSHLSEYGIWQKVLVRCLDETSPTYKNYGRRGIKVCERWMTLENFLEDMGPRPEGTTLGRIDNDGDYEPSNCRWETPEQQANNKQTTRRITFRGETLSMSQWARRANIPVETLFARLKKRDALQVISELF